MENKNQPSKIPFKVSARTAKLIGQENFSNPEGATIELVKNTYDADAKSCIVIFDIIFERIPEVLSPIDIKRHSINIKEIEPFYKLLNGKYNLDPKLNEIKSRQVKELFFKHNSIYIIDNGEGMSKDIIENYWMEIGTGNKEYKSISNDGRIKTGAKGIGRFALDRLGFFTEMWTVPKGKNISKGYYWKMNWKQFDVPNKSISEIQAELEEGKFSITPFIEDHFKKDPWLVKLINDKKISNNGTVIKISNLKDNWTQENLLSIYKSLQALIPPKELSIPFSVNFYHLQNPKSFGEVETAFFNDFDYKVIATYNSLDASTKITITRNELDLNKVKKTYGHLFKSAKVPYDINTLEKKTFHISKSAYELLKWEKTAHNSKLLRTLGDFSFSFYFLKTQTSSKEGYPYKEINAKERRAIIDKFGGIKIYRDSFRVRPYGDEGDDWLKLGEREHSSPAGAGQRIGDWRVGLNQVAGIIKISRIKNPDLIDKSDRGSLVENETFSQLKKIITAVIKEFEVDRSKILNPIYLEEKKKEEEERQKEIKAEAQKLVTRLFRGKKNSETGESYEKIIEETLSKFEKGDEDDAEIAQVRTLASLGLIVSSFAHELKEVKNNAGDINELENIFTKIVPEERKKIVEFKDGINIIDSLKKDNLKIVHWIDYSLTAIRKDKRKRGSIKLEKYFVSLLKDWYNVLQARNITIDFKNNISQDYIFRAFEMDMNTIFSNLISNSIDSFHNLKIIRDRKISINLKIVKNNIQVIYIDNGTGIPKVFQKDPEEIFLPFTTSKKDKDGNDIGTGLGMYLVKNVVSDNNGTVELMNSDIGFKIKIELPTRNKK